MSDTETPTQPALDMRNLQQRIAAVMAECTYVQKNRPKGMEYSIVSHDAVTKKVRPYLLKHGVRYHSTVLEHYQEGNRTVAEVQTTFVNIDEPEDTESIVTFGYGVDSEDKGPGKAMSYAVKYALLKTLALETGEDADLESIEYEAAEHQRQPAPDPTPSEPPPDLDRTDGGVLMSVYDNHMSRLDKTCRKRNLKKAEVANAIKDRFRKFMKDMDDNELESMHGFVNEAFSREAMSALGGKNRFSTTNGVGG